MPLVKKINIDLAKIGFWEITESENELLNKLVLTTSEKMLLDTFKAAQKRLQWLAARILVKDLLENLGRPIIKYDEFGKPFIENIPYISISHSGKYVVLGVSEKEIGVDIEFVKEKALNIATRFLSAEELKNVTGIHSKEIALTYWSAKESVMKIYGKKDFLFSKDIQIHDFIYNGKGETSANYKGQKSNKPYKIYYDKLEDYIFVVATEQ